MPNNLSGQIDLVNSTEGVAIPGNTDIASFTDGNTNDTSFNFTATIDWGDGVTTPGTVVGTNGSFTVLGGHTYGDEGFPNAVVTVTRNTDSAQLVLSGGVSVADADLLNVNPGPNITGSPGTSTGNVVIATFTDNFANSASDFTAPIDWGDGNTTAGTVTLSGGVYTISGSHTYTTNGAFTISTFATDDAPDAASNGTQIQAVIGLGGNLAPAITSGSEPFPIAAGETIANVSDSVLDPASDYTAMIDWGDGTTEIGTVTGSPGSFQVSSTVGHTYADEGDFTPTITINRAADGSNPSATSTITGTVVIAETDNLFSGSTTVTGSPGVGLTNVTVATVGGENDPNDLAVTIDWGDGTVTGGTVSGGNVLGSHTYAGNGQFAIAVTVNDDTNAQAFAFTDVQSTALIGLAPVAGDQITIAEGNSVAVGQEVATFTDNILSDTPSSFTATIDWGDGTTSTGTVTGGSGSFTVTSSGHTYSGAFGDEGQNTVTTTLTRTSDNTVATAFGAVNTTESDAFTLTADSISGNAGQPLNVQVATFTDTFTGHADGSDFTALVEWGDGTTTLGTISGSGGSFTVDGSHTYTAGGNDTLKVTVLDNAPGTASATATASANINLGGQVTLTAATEGTALANTTSIATFSDNVLTDTASDFTATVDWGDGITTPGTVVGGAGSFTVEGGHTYADEGTDTATVTLTRTSDSSTAAVSGQVTVDEGDSFTGHGTTISVSAFQPFSGTVATFTDTNTGNVAGDFTSTIDWGDGSTTNGTVTGSGGSFTVNGSHIYTGQGTDTVTVSILDDAPGTATGTATTTANIAALSGQMVFNSATEATAVPNNTAIARFVDSNGTDTASSFTASIDWGDGNTTTGTVVGSTGSFTVEGGHTYADEGNDPAKVVLTRTSDNASATASGTVAVAEGDVLTGHGVTNIKAKANQAFTGTVATFSDTDTANVSGDFNATIDWGDGTTTAGTITGGSGTFAVKGTHTYTHPGHENVSVTLADDAPGTATATANSTINVSSAPRNDFNGDNKSDLLLQFNQNSAHPDVMVELLNGTSIASSGTTSASKGWLVAADGDFNNDQKTDIVLQNTNGTPQIWLMNGTTRTSSVTLLNPGPAWHIVAAADFFGDGNSDLLFQNATDGAASIWQMNGTTIVGGGFLPLMPGSTWHVIGAGDFDGDGHADILWQNQDGQADIWLMNGTDVVGGGGLTPNLGPQWHAIGTGDFNGDGNADILWQNNDGTPQIWEMNGTSIIASAILPNPGSQYQAIGTGDFNGDGNADILFQRNSGTPLVYEMNGTSVISSFTLPSQPASWKLQDDGPLPFGQTAAAPTLGPTLQAAAPATPSADASSSPGIGSLSLTTNHQPIFAGAGGA